MAQRSSIRASDSDREQVADRLRRATAEGRLMAEELEQRLAAALRARTYGELDALVGDLPRERGPGPAPRGRSAVAQMLGPAAAIVVALMLGIVVAAVVVFLITGVFMTGLFWVLLVWWALGHRGHQHPRERGRVRRGAWM